MGDLHHLPLLGHDLPAAEPRRMTVFKEAGWWLWEHQARDGHHEGGVLQRTWAAAFASALEHLKGCR